MAFPDDDCVYPPGLLDRVADAVRDGPCSSMASPGERRTPSGASSASWKTDAAILTADNLWNRANAATIFLRRELVARVGDFDERLGLGSGEPWSSGEETDYLIRAVRGGARIEYDPSLVVQHDVREDDARVGARDGASVGYLLRKHDYPARVVARMLVRPLGGVLVLDRRAGSGAGPLPARDVSRPYSWLPRCEAREELRVTVEPRARARIARPPVAGPLTRKRVASATTRVTASASASGLGGSSRSKPSGCATPIPASSPTSSGTPPLRA